MMLSFFMMLTIYMMLTFFILRNTGLAELIHTFKEENIDEETALRAADLELNRLGVSTIGNR